MSQYTLLIDIEKGIRTNLVEHQYSLGLRKAFTQNSSIVENVAFAVQPWNCASNRFGWDESYQIGATTEEFKQGDVVSSSSTDVFPIAFQEAAILGATFNDFRIERDLSAPNNGFHFKIDQRGKNASAVIYMSEVMSSDTMVPAFISPKAYVNGSTTALVPVKRVKVFFEQKIVTRTMTTYSETNPLEVDFTDESDQRWFLNNEGNWKRL